MGGGGGGGRLNAKEFFDITALISINVMDLVGGFCQGLKYIYQHAYGYCSK